MTTRRPSVSAQGLDRNTARDIDSRVARILSDLGNPPPPLSLDDVRLLLKLDRGYYSATDPNLLQEVVHKLTLAGKQVIREPRRLLDVVRRLDLKALWLPDGRRILIDSELPDIKKRWAEGHEIGHSILPWHQVVMLGDKIRTLSPQCAYRFESEANYAAGRLLFMREEFRVQLGEHELGIPALQKLRKEFQNSLTSTLWRAVEVQEGYAFGLVSEHPQESVSARPVRHFIRSEAFCRRFPSVTEMEIYRDIQRFCRRGKGPLGKEERAFLDVDGASHAFVLEVFHNGYDTLTLGVHAGERTQTLITLPGQE
jgi:Zn-dependent peptidase ImmA (M78 family)